MLRLLLDRLRDAVFVELHNAVLPRILDIISEDRRALLPGCRAHQHLCEALPVEDIVSQHQRTGIPADKLPADHKGISQSPRLVLHLIGKGEPELLPGAEQLLEHRKIPRRRNNQNVPDARQHQRGQRIIDHRFVIHRHDLFRDGLRQRIEPRSRAACQNNSLHTYTPCRVFCGIRGRMPEWAFSRIGTLVPAAPMSVCEGDEPEAMMQACLQIMAPGDRSSSSAKHEMTVAYRRHFQTFPLVPCSRP